MNELEQIVQNMINAGESEENIAAVIQEYNKSQGADEGKTSATAEVTAPVVAEIPADTDLQLEDGSLESPRKSVRKQTREGELQAKAERQEETIANLENEYYKATKIDDVDTIKNKLSQSLKNNFDKGVFLTEQRDAYEQYKATGKLPDITDDQILKESESEFVAKERAFMEDVPEYAQTALKEKLGKRKEEQEATYNQSMIEYNDNFKSHETLIANLNESIKMGVDPTEDDINTLNASLEDLKKRGSDLIAQQAELGKTENIYDAFKRSYSDIDMLENVLAKTGVDIALGLSYTADILTAEDGKTRPHTKELINLSQELAKNKAEKLAKPIEVSSISSLSQFGEWAGDAIINFVPSGAMAMTGPAAMPLFFTSGYSGRMSEFAVNEAEAIKNIPLIKKQLEEAKDPANREKLVKELDRYNKAINTGDLTKLATSITYGAGEAVFERLGTVKLVNDLKKAAKTIPAQSYSEGIIKAVGKLPSGAIIEGGTEGLTTLTQNAADILIDGQDKSITEGMDEAMAQGALIGTGFKVAEGAIIGRAAMLDVISSKEEKAQIQSTLDEISTLTAELNNPEITKDRKKEIGDIISNKVKSVSESQDITSSRFLRLSKEQQQEVFELDRQSRFVNKKWTATASDPSISEASKDIIRKELEAEFNQLQQNKRNLIESADKRFKSLQLVDGLSEGDNLRNAVISETNLQKVKVHNKKSKFANKVVGLSEKDVSNMQEFIRGEESSFTTEAGEVLNKSEVTNIIDNQQGVDGLFDKENKNVVVFTQRAPYFNKAAAVHEYMHAAFMAKGLTQKDFNKVKNDLISHISFDAKDRLSDEQLEGVLKKLEAYNSKDQSEELFTIISDFINDDVIREKDKPLLSKLRDALKSSIAAITNPGEANNFKIDNGKQAFDFIKDFNRKIVKGKSINLGATSQPEDQELDVKAAGKVRKIRIFDFDDTLAKSNSQVLYTLPDGTTGKLSATEYAKKDQELKDKGATFDFSEFSKVIDGKKGPLFEVAQKINAARGNEDLFVLTARPADSAGPIQEFLKLAGLDFKKENIIGLGDGTAQAKADWVQGKIDEGYNDFYFADDAIKNVEAVKGVLSNANVKSKVQQAKASKIVDSVAFEEGSINQEFQKFTYDGKKNTAPESFQAEAAMAYEPLAQAVVDRISKVGLGVSKEQDQFIMDYLSDNQNKQDIVSDLTFGTERNKASSLLGLAKSYNPEVGSFGGYAKSQLANRAIRILEERVGKQITQGAQTIDAPESREVVAEDQRVETADIRNVFEKLNLPKEIIAKANKLAELASIKADKALTGKDVSDLKKVNARNKAFNDIFGKQLFKDIANELGKNTKTSDAFSQFINKNYDSLKDIALENIDFQKGGGPASLWNIDNPPSKEEFLNYYEAKDEKTSTRSDRKKSLNNAIARQIGNEARIEFAKKDPATAKLFKEKHGVVLASKIVLPNNKALQTLAGIAGFKDGAGMPASNVWKAFGAETNIGFNLSTEGGRKRAIKAMEFALTKGDVPLDAFATGALMINSSPRFFKDQESAYEKAKEEYRKNPTTENKKAKEEADKVRLKIKNDFTADMDTMINRIKKEGKATYLTGAAKGWTKNKFSFNKNGTSIEKILESFKNGTTAANNKANLAMFEQTMKPLYDLVIKDPKMVNLVMMLTNTSNGGSNLWFRLGAEVVGSSSFLLPGKEGKRGIEWEHAMQANNARLFLLNSAINKVPWGTVYPAVKRNYKVIALDKSLDDILKAAKRGNAMGLGWNVYTGHWTERYFHPDVFVLGGIDPSTIVDINGQTLADKYKIDSAGKSTKVMASKVLSEDFNKMLERVKGVKAEARYSEDRANKLAGNKGKFKFFVPYSAEDYVGLIYPTLGKGREGDRNLQWYKENIINPFAVGIANYEKSKVESLKQWRDLKKQISKTPAKLNKEAVRGFTNEEALRVYLWNEQDVVPETLAKKDVEALVAHVEGSKELSDFADNVKSIVGIEGYPKPGNDWLAGSLTIDLIDNINTAKRAEFLQQWQDNVDVVYSKDNMNKLKAIYGERYTEALENILYRMKTGRNRPSGATRLENQFMNWVNDSVGTVMFFNTRSALLQTISAVNFINWSDNNPLMAAKAFANQPQFWNDFSELFNSDFLKSRRSGLKNDINADELAKSAATADNKVRAALSSILKVGFLPTQIADSFAISIGGASFYRNRLNTYKKQGLSEEQAKEKAMLDFQETAEESQQSSRPDRVSMQQASGLGRVILAFANTPMQYTRLTKKAALDLVNGRGDWKTNLSKILYYGAVQNIIFTALQQAMFAMLFDDEELDDEEQTEASTKIVNGIADTFLRGSGVGGAAVATMKNIIMEIIKQKESKRPDYTKAALKLTTLSPPIDTKIRKLMSAGRAFTYKQSLKDMNRLGVDIDNPAALATGQVLSAVANLPADRAILKMQNVKGALNTEHEAWQRIAMALGFSDWQLGVEEDKSESARPISRSEKRKERRERRGERRKERRSSPNKRLERGVAGKAYNDGSIEVDPNLSPVEREKTIAHEKQHVKDMNAGKLDYDDNYVYWNGKKYSRKNGKIKYKGKWIEEGHPSLPWEKKAYDAEPSTKEIKEKKKRTKLY